MDSQLIEDGTYFIAEDRTEIKIESAKAIAVGRGGWDKRKTLFGGDQWTSRTDSLLDPRVDAAKIRSFFIHPDLPRPGIGSALLETCETAAKSAFFRAEMGATLTGVKLFKVRGYVPLESIEIPLENGASLPVVRMAKQLSPLAATIARGPPHPKKFRDGSPLAPLPHFQFSRSVTLPRVREPRK